MAADPAAVLVVCDRRHDDSETTVTVRGEIDASTADALWESLAAVAGASPRKLVIDLAGVDFLDSAGLHAFVRLRKTLPGHCPVMLRSLQPRVRQVFELTGLATAFDFG